MGNVRYWMWLQKVLGYGAKIKFVTESYFSAKEFYLAGEDAWKNLGITDKKISLMKNTTLESFEDVISFCKKHNIYIITPEDEFYPKALFDLENFPAVLFARGDYTCLNSANMLAVVGSRTPCAYSEQAINKIVPVLCDNNVVTVSGGALGIDSLVHKSTIENNGKTVLVLGYGHGTVYLPENGELRKLIAKNGVIITEYPPYYEPTAGSFSHRNRIIVGISKALAVVEAAANSNTLSIAKFCTEKQRKVLVLPGDINSGRFEGSNALVRSGAEAFFCGEDIVNSLTGATLKSSKNKITQPDSFDLINVEATSTKKKKKKAVKAKKEIQKEDIKQENTKINVKNIPEGISKNAEIVYNIMSGDITYLDEITREAKLHIRDVLVSLTELEMIGVVSAVGPNKYKIN